MAVRPRFDPNRDFVAARGFTFLGHGYAAGEPFKKEGVRRDRLSMIYESRMIDFAPPKSAEPEQAGPDPIGVESAGGGWFALTAPWLDEPVKVKGRAAAEAEAQRMRDEGEPAKHHGVALSEGENGWYEVSAAWLDEPEKVHGEEAARARAAELRSAGPPPERVTIEAGMVEGTFVVKAAWAEDGEVVDSEDAAAARADELRREGPPEGWEPAAPDPMTE